MSTSAAKTGGLTVTRHHTTAGIHPFDEVEWELRDAVIGDPENPAFEQHGVEFPKSWSQNATNIVAQKYFRGRIGTERRESSVKQMIGRVAGTIAGWGRDGGYFASEEDGDAFEAELTHILLHQKAAFNSPVWFNVGFEEKPQCSACQPYNAMVSTPDGMVPIGELVTGEQIGREVYDADGVTRVVAVKANGRKPVRKVRLRNGSFIEATPDHVVKASRQRRDGGAWLRVDELEPGMRLHLHPHRAKVVERALVAAGGISDGSACEPPGEAELEVSEKTRRACAEAALAGWLQADGFVGQYEHGTNRSLTIEFQVANDDEFAWVSENLDIAFEDVHRHVREADTMDTRVQRIRLYGEVLREFVESWGLLARGTEIRVPQRLFTATFEQISAYLRSIFQADGYMTVGRASESERGRIGFAVIGERWTEDVQLLLNLIGIYSRRTHKREARSDRHDMYELAISIGSERARFAELVGFVAADKQARLLESLALRKQKRCPDLREEEIVAIDDLGVEDVYDIQTESGEYLSNNVTVHNCFILSVDDTMESILDWNTKEGQIFRGGSGSGINLSNIRGSVEHLSKGGLASGPVSFMRGADSWAGTIKSGGKTRRAAKMVVLDIDHPDIEDFIWCKAKEERKANALRDAGFDMSIDGDGFNSIQYQNANNSVRITDAFMEAVEADGDWDLIARNGGETTKTVRARDLLEQISEAAWQCADPGVQYDTIINRWHTSPESGRINASNPCFPGDARVHTTAGLMSFEELYERALFGEHPRVYTHRATAGENGAAQRPKGEGVIDSEPLAVMSNGVKPILRLRFSDGRELRCTANHRLWTTNRGYVAAEDLTESDQVMLNDSPTPATDASWELPVQVAAPVQSAKRGGTVTLQGLPERWTEGLGELTGHLIGDGWMTDVQTGWCYGGDDIVDGLDDSHEGILEELLGGISRQEMDNGTVQLRAGSETVRCFFRTLGVTTAKAPEKRVPASIFTAPAEVQAAFLRGLFGADGCVSRKSGNKGYHYVGLGSRSQVLLRDVLRLLSSFGVRGRIYSVSGSDTSKFSYTRADGSEATYRSRQGYDLRVTGSDLERFAAAIGFSTPRKEAALECMLAETGRYATKGQVTLAGREEDGQETVYNLTEPLHHSYLVDGVVVANCSEYMHVDDSACNLASINLMKFRRDDGSFDAGEFEKTVDVVFLAQEIVVSPSSYPTEKIGENARAFRQLGLGYANLGALLMSDGVPYDSDEGRNVAGAITALMTGRGYRKSAEVAAAVGTYEAYPPNREAHNSVMRMHRDASYKLDSDGVKGDLVEAAQRSWDEAVELGDEHGYRNAQATVLAPTGTISFLMDCDTTGIEPDFSLVKFKELVGGGSMTIVNRTVPMALQTLGYSESEIEQIEAYINDKNTIVGAPGLKDAHLPVFDVAVGERAISHMGHIKMMAAAQPFLSGAISKTVNLPQSASVGDIAEAYSEGWKHGLKALAIYRDGSKTAQALRTDAQEEEAEGDAPAPLPARHRMPVERESITHKFSLGGHEGYITAGKYEDGSVGEIFLTDIGKEGSTIKGLMNAFATAISIGLQYGVPLETFVNKFAYIRFEPEGITRNPEIPFAKSLPDYIVRWLASRFLDADYQEELGILTPEVRARKEAQQSLFVNEGPAPSDPAPAEGEAKPANGNGGGSGHGGNGGGNAAAKPAAEAKAPATAPAASQAPTSALTDSPPVRPARMSGLDLGPACEQCGGMMQRTGSCYTCSSCGNNTGCG